MPARTFGKVVLGVLVVLVAVDGGVERLDNLLLHALDELTARPGWSTSSRMRWYR